MFLSEKEFEISSFDVLRLVQKSSCSAYDGEFVALAMQLETVLVTADQKLIKAFPKTAVALADMLA